MKDEGESRDKNPMASWRKEGWYRAELRQDAHD